MERSTLKKIEHYALEQMSGTLDPQHDLGHIERVRRNALSIAKVLRIDKQIDTDLLEAACLLHDLTYTKYSPGIKTVIFERWLVRGMVHDALSKFDLNKREKDVIYEAIISHPNSVPFRILNTHKDDYCKILQDADTLDFFAKERMDTLINIKNKSRFQKLLNFAGKYFLKFGFMDKKRFLNFPEIVEKLDV